MTKLSYGQQAEIITKLLKEEIKTLDSLPKEEAKKVARKSLQEAGIVDKQGNFTRPYIALKG